MGAYWRWALIRGWALIRINTVAPLSFLGKFHKMFSNLYTVEPRFRDTSLLQTVFFVAGESP